MLGSSFFLVLLVVVVVIVVVIVSRRKKSVSTGNVEKPQEKIVRKKSTPAEKWLYAGLTVFVFVSLFLPWIKSFIVSNNFWQLYEKVAYALAVHVQGAEEVRAYIIAFFPYVEIPLSILLLSAVMSGNKKFLIVMSRLVGVCVCLLVFGCIGFGGDKLFGFYLTMLSGIALVAFSFFIHPYMEGLSE